MSAQPRLRYKVVLVGDSGVGKTSLTSRFARDQFSPQFHSTVGVELASRTLSIG
jgi:GTPase SAR1 family protein